MSEDLAAFKRTKEEEIKRLRAMKEAIVHNFNLLHTATQEELAALDGSIAKAAEALHHAESLRVRAPAPAPTPAPAAPAAPAPAAAPRVETLERDGRHVWEQGRHKVYDSNGKLLRDEEDKPDFPVEVPSSASRTKHVTAWQGVGHAEWSPADEIDERGMRHVRRAGRHRVYGQDGTLISDTDDSQGESASSPASPTNGTAASS